MIRPFARIEVGMLRVCMLSRLIITFTLLLELLN